MALYKEIMQDNGVVTNYHRILFYQVTPNRQNSVIVSSYCSQESRMLAEADTAIQPYSITTTYEFPYDESMDISKAYELIKTLSVFEDAEDV